MLVIISLFLLLVTSMSGATCNYTSETNATLSLVGLDPSEYPEALCNDGSPGAYYILENDPTCWLVYLAGGGWCYDEDSCRDRQKQYPDLMTSTLWPRTCSKTGVFDEDPNKSPVATCTKVYIPYCTSDAHMGNAVAATTANKESWNFKGEKVVNAVLQELVRTYNFGSADTTYLLFGGGSAGARGAMIHADTIVSRLRKYGVANDIELSVYLDSPLWIEVDPLNSDFVGFAQETQLVYDWTNITKSLLGTKCSALYTDEEAWRCIFGQYRLPQLDVPAFVVASRFDSWQLSWDIFNTWPAPDATTLTAEQQQYAETFGNQTNSILSVVQKAVPGNNVFSQSCFDHHVGERDYFWLENIRNVTQKDILESFIQTGTSIYWTDNCEDFNCGDGCYYPN